MSNDHTRTAQLIGQFEEFFRVYQTNLPHLALDDATKTNIEQSRKWLSHLKTEEFPVAFIGSFSVGKSTIINAIIGKELLPEDVKAVTAFPTLVRKGARNEADVYYIDETAKAALRDQLLAELRAQITDQALAGRIVIRAQESPNDNLLRIAEVRKEYQSKAGASLSNTPFRKLQQLLTNWNTYTEKMATVPLATIPLGDLRKLVEGHDEVLFIDRIEAYVADIDLDDKIVLVDLPGLDVANQRHVEFTRHYMRTKAKAIVACLKPKHLLEGQEIQLLKELHKENPTILQRSFWVINQWDLQDEWQRQREEANFHDKMAEHQFRIAADHFFKVSALNYLLLFSIANSTLETTEDLKRHVQNLKTITQDPEQLRTSPTKAQAYLESVEEVRAFAEFRTALFTYLNGTAKEAFLQDARHDLRNVTTVLMERLAPFYHAYRNGENSETDLLFLLANREVDQYLARLQKHIDQFVQQVKNPERTIYWTESQQNIARRSIDNLREIYRNEVRRELSKGEDVDWAPRRFPAIVDKKLKLTRSLRDEMINAVQDSFIKDLQNLLHQLTRTDKGYLPEKVVKVLEDKLGRQDISMRLYGLADKLFSDYDQKLEAIALSLKEIQAQTRDEFINRAFQHYEEELAEYINQLTKDINSDIKRSIKNHAEYLQDELMDIFKQDEHNLYIQDIRQQMLLYLKNSDVMEAERRRQATIHQAYQALDAIRSYTQ